jgi:hypothetical protein
MRQDITSYEMKSIYWIEIVLRLESFNTRGTIYLIQTYCSLCYKLVRWYMSVKITDEGGAIFHTVLFYSDIRRAPAVLLPLCGHMGGCLFISNHFCKTRLFLVAHSTIVITPSVQSIIARRYGGKFVLWSGIAPSVSKCNNVGADGGKARASNPVHVLSAPVNCRVIIVINKRY